MNCTEEIREQSLLWREVSQFLTYYGTAPSHLDPDSLVVLNGCCSVFSVLAMVLHDPDEAFLVLSPFCGGLVFSSLLYVKADLTLAHLDSETTDLNTCPVQLMS
ncbi:hypothetical protein HPG69_003390 [Diceros bicornis minor]|uniref:Uncharacterized protein n=1 Tax=Diceros bicornis minor TaxID=77932 RepID=A0A7J7E9R7_DICBM|nr:hypothetical protein HPG69_003390 [Diceros bicornis minor]